MEFPPAKEPPPDQLVIARWAAAQAQAPDLILVPHEGAAGEALSHFCDRLREQVSSLRVRRESGPLWPAPSLVVGRHGNIAFQAVPAGKTMSPFLEALAQAPPALDAQIAARLQQIDPPVPLKLYIAPGCPHCLRVLGEVLPLALEASQLRLTIVDATLLPEAAAADAVRSVPTLILDSQIRWTGQIDVTELVTLCVSRDPAEMSTSTLRQLLEAGGAKRAAGMMIACGRVFPALIELLVDPSWSVRLGAMVSAECLCAEAPGLADGLIAPLWSRLADLPEQVQGDLVHVLGRLTPTRVEGRLQDVLRGSFPESVQQAAAEALEAMADPRGRH